MDTTPGPANANGDGTVVNYNLAPTYNNSTIGHDPNEHMQSVSTDKLAAARSVAFDQQRLAGV